MSELAPLLDAHQAPPQGLKEQYKRYQKLKTEDLDFDPEIKDFGKAQLPDGVEILEPINSTHLASIFSTFAEGDNGNQSMIQDAPVYSHKKLPGRNLFYFPIFHDPVLFSKALISESLPSCQDLMARRSPYTASAIAIRCTEINRFASTPSGFV
jgi:hypothetical protein